MRSRPTPTDADVLVVNTCAFIDRAKKESVDAILEMAELKGRQRRPPPDRDGLPRRALSRRAQERDPGNRRGARAPVRCRGFSRRSAPARLPAGPHTRTDARNRSRFYKRGAGRRPDAARHAALRHRSAGVSLRRRHAASSRHTWTLRVSEDRRRLRLQVRLLHHPEDARALPQPHARVDRPRGARAGRARREGTAAHLAGHDLLRRRSQGTRRARAAAARAQHRRRHRVDPAAVSLSDDDLRGRHRSDGRVRQGLQLHRPAAAARVRSGARADEAARDARQLRAAADEHPRAHPERHAPHHLHRRLPGRDRGRLRRAHRFRRRRRLRPRRRLHLLARGRHLGVRSERRRSGRG